MPVPSLVNGVLPPGTYQATLSELVAAFDQLGSNTRPALNAAVRHAAALIWSRDASAIIFINGSYVTDKRDPLDIDVAVRSYVWDDALFTAALFAAYPGEEALVDSYFNVQQSQQRMEELFRQIQGRSVQKGIIQLLP
ncbi:MAG: DUF6932 family protein [Ktedonobacterales bacterium]